METRPQPKWDEHIQVVFSVLAGLSFAEAFRVLAASGFRTTEIVLSVAVFYIVLDNWYFLHKDLAVIDIESPAEVTFYLLSLLMYACLPYLYGINSNIPIIPSPPEWMLLNLALICFVDALRKTITLTRMRKARKQALDIFKRKLAGSYVFYSLTGYFYGVLLFLAISFSASSTWSLTLKSLVVVAIWAIIRGIDIIVIPRTANLMANIFLEKEQSQTIDQQPKMS